MSIYCSVVLGETVLGDEHRLLQLEHLKFTEEGSIVGHVDPLIVAIGGLGQEGEDDGDGDGEPVVGMADSR